MSKPVKTIKYNGKNDEQSLNKYMVTVSEGLPGHAVLALSVFGNVRVIVYKTLASVNPKSQEAAEMMFSTNGHIAIVDGKLMKPTNRQAKAFENARFSGLDS